MFSLRREAFPSVGHSGTFGQSGRWERAGGQVKASYRAAADQTGGGWATSAHMHSSVTSSVGVLRYVLPHSSLK